MVAPEDMLSEEHNNVVLNVRKLVAGLNETRQKLIDDGTIQDTLLDELAYFKAAENLVLLNPHENSLVQGDIILQIQYLQRRVEVKIEMYVTGVSNKVVLSQDQ